MASAMMFCPKARSLTIAGGERQVGAGRDVVNVLQHRPAFVRAPRRRIVLNHIDRVGRIQVARAYEVAKPARRIGLTLSESTPIVTAGAVDVELRARHIGEHRGLGLVVRDALIHLRLTIGL